MICDDVIIIIRRSLGMTSTILFKSQKASIASTNHLNWDAIFQFCLNFRYGANANPTDGGSLPIIALLDKLLDDPYNQIHVEICLKILLKTVPAIEMPYKVNKNQNL